MKKRGGFRFDSTDVIGLLQGYIGCAFFTWFFIWEQYTHNLNANLLDFFRHLGGLF